MMASEIETHEDLLTAASHGYKLFGAGGFMGDSEKAWDAESKNISMAVKVLRVHVDGKQSPFPPVKTGDDLTGGKFEADGLLDAADLTKARDRTNKLKQADMKVGDAELQELFSGALSQLIGPE